MDAGIGRGRDRSVALFVGLLLLVPVAVALVAGSWLA